MDRKAIDYNFYDWSFNHESFKSFIEQKNDKFVLVGASTTGRFDYLIDNEQINDRRNNCYFQL